MGRFWEAFGWILGGFRNDLRLLLKAFKTYEGPKHFRALKRFLDSFFLVETGQRGGSFLLIEAFQKLPGSMYAGFLNKNRKQPGAFRCPAGQVATVGQKDELLFAALATAAERRMGDSKPQELANTMNSFSSNWPAFATCPAGQRKAPGCFRFLFKNPGIHRSWQLLECFD